MKYSIVFLITEKRAKRIRIDELKTFFNSKICEISIIHNLDEAIAKSPNLIISKFFDVIEFNTGTHQEVEEYLKLKNVEMKNIKSINDLSILTMLTDRKHELDFSLALVNQIKSSFRCIIPKFQIIRNSSEFINIQDYPIILKSLNSRGPIAKFHECTVLLRKEDAKPDKIKYPIISQEFLNHNGICVKVYIIGDHISITQIESIENSESLQQSFSFKTKNSIKNINKQFQLSPGELASIEEFGKDFRKLSKLEIFNLDLLLLKRNDALSMIEEIALVDLNIFPTCKNVPNSHRFFHELISRYIPVED